MSDQPVDHHYLELEYAVRIFQLESWRDWGNIAQSA